MNHWDEKFDTNEYIYGTEPNEWIASRFKKDGENKKAALLAEGEGRNAVYLAKLGYEVTTYDLSKKGIEKTESLAQSQNVNVNTNFQDITAQDAIPENTYDAGIIVFGHVAPADKERMFANLIRCVKPNGHIVFEFYSKQQLEFGTGGPRDIDMLFTVDEIKGYIKDFPVEISHLEEKILERNEGIMHKGKSAVIQGHLTKK